MRKAVLTLFASLLLAGGLALAQDVDAYAGGNLGYTSVFGLGAFHFGVHGGAHDLIAPNFGVRGDLDLYLGGGVGIGASAIYNTNLETEEPINVYAGAGPRVLVGGGGAAFGLGFMGGGEYMVAPEVGLFGEIATDIYFGGGLGVTVFGLGLGANFHF